MVTRNCFQGNRCLIQIMPLPFWIVLSLSQEKKIRYYFNTCPQGLAVPFVFHHLDLHLLNVSRSRLCGNTTSTIRVLREVTEKCYW